VCFSHEPFASVSLSLSLSLYRRVRSINSLSCADSEGHRPRIIGEPIQTELHYSEEFAASHELLECHLSPQTEHIISEIYSGSLLRQKVTLLQAFEMSEGDLFNKT
jgi:hypothetical protein